MKIKIAKKGKYKRRNMNEYKVQKKLIELMNDYPISVFVCSAL